MSKHLDAALAAMDECLDCDDNAPHGANTEEEMDVDDDHDPS